MTWEQRHFGFNSDMNPHELPLSGPTGDVIAEMKHGISTSKRKNTTAYYTNKVVSDTLNPTICSYLPDWSVTLHFPPQVLLGNLSFKDYTCQKPWFPRWGFFFPHPAVKEKSTDSSSVCLGSCQNDLSRSGDRNVGIDFLLYTPVM